jgi:hypothetical protein
LRLHLQQRCSLHQTAALTVLQEQIKDIIIMLPADQCSHSVCLFIVL